MVACLLPSVLRYFNGVSKYAIRFLNSAMQFSVRLSLYVFLSRFIYLAFIFAFNGVFFYYTFSGFVFSFICLFILSHVLVYCDPSHFRSKDVQELKASRHTLARCWVYLSPAALEGWYTLMRVRKVE